MIDSFVKQSRRNLDLFIRSSVQLFIAGSLTGQCAKVPSGLSRAGIVLISAMTFLLVP